MTYIPFEKIKIVGSRGLTAETTAFGEQAVVSRQDQVNIQFQYNAAAEELVIANTGTAVVNYQNSQLVASTGTTSNSKSIAQSKKYIAYESGHEVFILFTAEYSTPVVGTYQRVGAFDDLNGFFIGFDTTGQFGVTRRRNGTDYTTYQSNFSYDKLDGTGPSQMNLNKNYNNLYKITYGWLGIAPVTFWINSGTLAGWVPFHTIDLTNSQNGATIDDPVQPMKTEVFNGTTTSNIIVRNTCWAGGIYSDILTQHQPSLRNFSQNGLKTINTNVFQLILTLRNKTTFNSKTNKISAYLKSLSYTTDGGNTTKPVKILVFENATNTGTPTWTNVHTDSIIEYDTSQLILSSGKQLLTIGTAANGGDLYEFQYPIRIYPGSSLSFYAWSTASNTVDVCLNWYEDF